MKKVLLSTFCLFVIAISTTSCARLFGTKAVYVAHIFKKYPEGTENTPGGQVLAQKLVQELKTAKTTIAVGGVSFAQAAYEGSDDRKSGANGGVIGWLTAETAEDPVFRRTMLALDEGEMSDIIRTKYGLHVLKCLKISYVNKSATEPLEKNATK